MKLFGNFEFRNKNNKPKDYHKVKKNKDGVIVLEIIKNYYPDCFCENCCKITENQQKTKNNV